MYPKPPRTWILVADSAKARALLLVGRDQPLKAVAGFDMHYRHPRGHDITTERPGRVHESQGATRHAVQPHSDPVRETERHFAKAVAEALDQRFRQGEFDRFVLVTGPTMLGDLRTMMPPKLKAALYKILEKDLTHLTNAKLKQHLVDGEVI